MRATYVASAKYKVWKIDYKDLKFLQKVKDIL